MEEEFVCSQTVMIVDDQGSIDVFLDGTLCFYFFKGQDSVETKLLDLVNIYELSFGTWCGTILHCSLRI